MRSRDFRAASAALGPLARPSRGRPPRLPAKGDACRICGRTHHDDDAPLTTVEIAQRLITLARSIRTMEQERTALRAALLDRRDDPGRRVARFGKKSPT